jgi:DNA-binding NarL/FixJ family response regulator
MSGAPRWSMLVEMVAHPTHIPEAPVSVFIAARHEAIRTALWTLFQSEPGVEPLAVTASAEDLARLLATVSPAVVVVEESVLGPDGIAGLPAIVAATPQSAFIVVGMNEHPAYVARARAAGAADYVRLDDADRLGRAVVEASDRSRPFAAGRRRAGSRARTVVPAPGAVSTVSRPPSSSTRSRIPSRPKPPVCSEGS